MGWSCDCFIFWGFSMKKICIFDYDGCLIHEYAPKGETLSAFARRNTFWKNLFYKTTNLLLILLEEKSKGNLIVICTAREYRWWLPFVLWFKGIPYDVLIQRYVGDMTPTGILKQKQILEFIISNNDYIFADKDFYDDNQENLDMVGMINNVRVYNANLFI